MCAVCGLMWRNLLVEAGPRALSGFPEKLADFARRSLGRVVDRFEAGRQCRPVLWPK